MTGDPLRLVVPALSSAPAEGVLQVASAIAHESQGECTVLGIAEVPPERSLSEGALVVRRRRNLLRRIESVQNDPTLRVEVRTSHSLEEGVRDAVQDMGAELMVMDWSSISRKTVAGPAQRLIAAPPCDLAVVKSHGEGPLTSVLVPARGGPHAALAIRIAQALASQHGAVLTLLHVVLPTWDEQRREREGRFFDEVRDSVSYENLRFLNLEAESVESALLREGKNHDLVVMGAAGRDQRSSYVLGQIPETVASNLDANVVVVRTRRPVTAAMFGVPATTAPGERDRDLSELVDRWFAENTFHSDEFRNIQSLLALKERRGVTISLALPTLNEEKTVGKIISTIKRRLVEQYSLIDEMIVIDSNSQDRTAEIAESLGVPVFQHPEVLPQYGSYRGKGEGLWKSLQVTTGDIIVWIDSDITGIHPKFVYGLIGPLLVQPRIGFVKGFYRRPLRLGGELLTTGGGRVTELTARPLINLFYPQLSGVVQPLAGEMAGRRKILQSVPMFTGYGVETGLLIDILERFGLQSIAQVDLQERVHRNQTLLSLSKMAFAIVQVVMKRLGDSDRLQLLEDMNRSMKLIHYSPTELFLEVQDIEEHERPPMVTLPEYEAHIAKHKELAGAPA